MKPIIVTEIIKKDIKTVWSAITKLDQMVLWFFNNIPEFKAEVGFKTSFSVRSGKRHFLHVWEIVEVITEKKIMYNWRYPEYYEGDSFVTFQLEKKPNNQTQITVVAERIENYPQDIPEFKRESGVNGWNYFIKESLPNYLDTL